MARKRTGSHGSAKRYGPIHDTILFYTHSGNFLWNPIFTEYDEEYKKRFSYVDEKGRHFQPISLIAAGTRAGSTGQAWRGIDVTNKGNHWRYTIEKLNELDAQGKIYWSGGDSLPRLKFYLDESQGSPVQEMKEI